MNSRNSQAPDLAQASKSVRIITRACGLALLVPASACLAPSFAASPHNASARMLPVALPAAVGDLHAQGTGRQLCLEIDLERCEVRDRFGLNEHSRSTAVAPASPEGDEIDVILQHEPDIAAYERRRADALA